MFIGHLALGFAAKRVAPRVSLAVLVSAAQLADILWPVFIALGIEQVRIVPGFTAFTPFDFVSYPYSHSLVFLAGWGLLLGVIYQRLVPGSRVVRLIAMLVVSHWVLDFVTHRPDMPIVPGGPEFGLGLWNSIPATLIVEVVMYVAGLWLYMRATRARDGIGRWGFRLAGHLRVRGVPGIDWHGPAVNPGDLRPGDCRHHPVDRLELVGRPAPDAAPACLTR